MTAKELLKQVKELNYQKQYNKAIALLEQEGYEQYKNADLYAEKSLAHWRLNEYAASESTADDALKIDMLHVKALLYKGNAYSNLKKYDDAIKVYEQIIEINPRNITIYYNLGSAYAKLKRYDEAIKTYWKPIEIDPQNANAYYNLGNAYFESKEYDEAIKAYLKAIDLNPLNANAYFNVGYVYDELKQYREAISAYQKAIDINPNFLHAYAELGNVFFGSKQYTEAIKAYQKVIDIDPYDIDVYYNRGLLYYALERYEEAHEDLEKYLELNKKDDNYKDTARDKIRELKQLRNKPFANIKQQVTAIKKLLLYGEDCVTHYTSFTVSNKLLFESAKFRLSEGAFLNDPSEGKELFYFLPSLKNQPDAPGKAIAELFARKPFIGSFVTAAKHDDLTLWRMYGKENNEDAKGCALTLSREGFLQEIKIELSGRGKSGMAAQDYNFYKVAYQNDNNSFSVPGMIETEVISLNKYMVKLKEVVTQFANENNNDAAILEAQKQLNSIAYLFKNAQYEYEHELRLVIDGVGIDKYIDKDCIPNKILINLINISKLITRITIGPKVARQDEWAAALFYKLEKENLSADVYVSHLPYK